jgi:hypothetical protein
MTCDAYINQMEEKARREEEVARERDIGSWNRSAKRWRRRRNDFRERAKKYNVQKIRLQGRLSSSGGQPMPSARQKKNSNSE